MYRRHFLLLFFILGLMTSGVMRGGVVAPSVLVQHYSVDDYKASCQNWDLAISSEGLLLVANNSGLLTFDGNNWRCYSLPDHSPIYRLFLRGDTLFSQGAHSAGYWRRDQVGDWMYYPLSAPIPAKDANRFIEQGMPEAFHDMQPTAFVHAGGLCFLGTATSGLYVTTESGEVLRHLHSNNLLKDNIVRAIRKQDDNRIWVALDNGISQIDINPPITMLGKRGRIGKLEAAVKVDSLLYIRTNSGFFQRSLAFEDQFEPISPQEGERYLSALPQDTVFVLEELFQEVDRLESFVKADGVYPAPNQLYWITAKNEAGLFHQEDGHTSLKCRILFDNYQLNLVSYGRRFFPLNDSLDLISTMQGAILINTRQFISSSLGGVTMPRITRLEYQDDERLNILPPNQDEVRLPHDFRSLSVYVGTTVFTPHHQISYHLEGVSTGWSDWQKEGKISLLQLPEGTYDLRIRKYVIRGPYPEVSLRITVSPPWYNTVWAYLIYVLLIGLAIQGGIRLHLRELRREEQEKMRNDQEAERQRLQRMRSEMLETELQNKNNELTLQTTALVKRNEAMQALLEELDKQKESLGDRYPNKLYTRLRSLMESTLNDQADWVQFETYFNSAHHNFMDRLRLQYADITAGDLRICCLLRMNLSTKEIASLMNVSVRAIEIRRYRLRKRLALDTDTNLVDFLMRF